jgi:predicted transcriptional regulator
VRPCPTKDSAIVRATEPAQTYGETIGLIFRSRSLGAAALAVGRLHVSDGMIPRDQSLVIDAETDLAKAMHDLGQTEVGRALVSDHGHIEGRLSMTNAARTFEVLAVEDIGYLGGRPVAIGRAEAN